MVGEGLVAGAVLAPVIARVVFVAGADVGVVFVESDSAAVEPVIASAGGAVPAAAAAIMAAAVVVEDAVAFVAEAEGWDPGACHIGTLRGLQGDTCWPSPSPQSWVPCPAEEDP